MSYEDFFEGLRKRISPESRVVINDGSAEYQAASARWSNLGALDSAATVLPICEKDIQTCVKGAVRHGIPFVPVSGGHSPWSTTTGFTIDLRKYAGITVHDDETATIRGGLLMKEFQLELYKHGRFAAVANGNTVGVIPYYLNGGISAYGPLLGYACESIIGARMIDARGEIVNVSQEDNVDLLWALRGAGQFFGLVVELTIRTAPLALLGNPSGTRAIAMFTYLPHQVESLIAALESLVDNESQVSAGHIMILQAPPAFEQQIIVVAPQVFCSEEKAAEALLPLIEANPIQKMISASSFEEHSDHVEWINAKGDLKRFVHIGLSGWDTNNFKRLIELHAELVDQCPGAARSVYTVEWHSPCRAQREYESAFGLEDVGYWLNLLSWYTDEADSELVGMMEQQAQVAMRHGTPQEAYVSYSNASRSDPIEHRYKGSGRIEKLRSLKRKWDPDGVFTSELL